MAQDMARVDEVIAKRLSSGVPLVGQVAQYIISAGGKRLRPLLVLAAHEACVAQAGASTPTAKAALRAACPPGHWRPLPQALGRWFDQHAS